MEEEGSCVLPSTPCRSSATPSRPPSLSWTARDAKALNAPLLAQCEVAQLKLATLPQRRELPNADTVDPERFRAAVLQAWTNKPLDLRREALDRLIDRITLSDGGAHVDYAVNKGVSRPKVRLDGAR